MFYANLFSLLPLRSCRRYRDGGAYWCGAAAATRWFLGLNWINERAKAAGLQNKWLANSFGMTIKQIYP